MNKLSSDRYMRRISAERYIEQLRAEVYPIALIKFLLNKRRIMNYFSKAASRDFNPKFKFDLDIENCEACKQKKDQGNRFPTRRVMPMTDGRTDGRTHGTGFKLPL